MELDKVNFDKVREFNVAFGKEVHTEPNINFLNKSIDHFHLIESEYNEFISEICKIIRSNEEILDGLVDMNYVIYGDLCYMGYTSDTLIIHTGVNTKLTDNINEEIKNLTNLIALIKKLSDKTEIVRVKNNEEENEEDNTIEMPIEYRFRFLADILIIASYKVRNIARLFKFDYDAAFELVHDANMTKLCENTNIAKKTVEYYESIKDTTDYKYPDYRLSPCEKFYVVYNNDTSENPINNGKILKSINWKEPDLSVLFNIQKISKHVGLTLIIGPMFADKTSYLFKQYDRMMLQNYKCLIIKYIKDNRFGSNENILITHDGKSRPAISADNLSAINILDEYDALFIDEIQFINFDLDELLELSKTKAIFVSGLSGDYQMKPFNNVSNLIPIAIKIKHMRAICLKNGKKAAFTKRTLASDNREIIGDNDIYKAVDLDNYFE